MYPFQKGPEVSHLIGKRFTDSVGQKWELTGHNDLNVPYFSKVSAQSGQAGVKQYSNDLGKEFVKLWLAGF